MLFPLKRMPLPYGEIETTFSLASLKNITSETLVGAGIMFTHMQRPRHVIGQSDWEPQEEGFGICGRTNNRPKPAKKYSSIWFNEILWWWRCIEAYRNGLNRLLEMLGQSHWPELILFLPYLWEKGFGIPAEHIEARNKELKSMRKQNKEVAIKGKFTFHWSICPIQQREINTQQTE